MKIRMNGMEFFIMLKNEGRKIIKIGVNISIIGKAASEPYKVRIKAIKMKVNIYRWISRATIKKSRRNFRILTQWQKTGFVGCRRVSYKLVSVGKIKLNHIIDIYY